MEPYTSAKREMCESVDSDDYIIDIKTEDHTTQLEIKQESGLIDPDGGESNQYDHCDNPHTGNDEFRNEQYQCSQCGKTIIGKQNLIRHSKSHTGEKPYICNHCDKAFSRSDNLKTHMRLHIVRQSKINLVGDVTDLTGEILYSSSHCDDPGKDLFQKFKYNDNIKTRIKSYKCTNCGKSFKTKQSLIKHNVTHTEDKSYQCRQCEKAFSVNRDLLNHMRTHSGEKIYKCNECDKNFSLAHNLERHLITHTGVKPHTCGLCDKTFSRNDNLKTHIRLYHNVINAEDNLECHMTENSGENTFLLNNWDKTENLSSKNQNLTNFIKNEMEAYTCTICDEICFSKQSFISHNKTHTRKIAYQCSYCEMTFTVKRDFRRHTRKHTGEKPYECNQCDKTFTGKQNLVRHLRAHAGDRPFQCNECGTAYSDNRDLTRHLKTHTGEKPFQCSICGKTFIMNSYLLCHIRKMHTRE